MTPDAVRLLPLPGVFQPHSDSWLLADRIRSEQLPDHASVLDLCTGSGLLAVVAASQRVSRVVAVDVSRRAVLAARLNAKRNGVRVHAMRGDLFSPVGVEQFDLIVSNPPYLPSPSETLPTHGAARAWEAGREGRAIIDRICASVYAHLRPGGVLLLVHSSVCSEQATVGSLVRRGLRTAVVERRPGPLGPRLRARAGWLRAQGLLGADDREEILIFRAQRPSPETASTKG
jgi:release factor glutamine methyltransferase